MARRRALPALVLLAGCAAARAAAQECHRGGADVPLLRVAWIERAPLDPLAFAQMEREAGEILDRLGLRVSLQRGTSSQLLDHELRVVLLDSFAPDERVVMGATLLPWSIGRGARIYIFGPAVRGLVAHERFRPDVARRHGRALARILTHEIVHALAPGLGHAEEGLMSRTLKADTLDSPVAIDAQTLAALEPVVAAFAAQVVDQ
jgi:hypothetical protein